MREEKDETIELLFTLPLLTRTHMKDLHRALRHHWWMIEWFYLRNWVTVQHSQIYLEENKSPVSCAELRKCRITNNFVGAWKRMYTNRCGWIIIHEWRCDKDETVELTTYRLCYKYPHMKGSQLNEQLFKGHTILHGIS